MRVVLHDGVRGLGSRGDLVDVTDGYARNYLIPKGLAQRASPGAEEQAEKMRQAWQFKNAKDREAAEEIAKRLVTSVIAVEARASGEGKLFGSVSAVEVTEAVELQTGVVLDRKMVEMEEPIRTVGTHSVTVHPHADVQFPVTVEVASA